MQLLKGARLTDLAEVEALRKEGESVGFEGKVIGVDTDDVKEGGKAIVVLVVGE